MSHTAVYTLPSWDRRLYLLIHTVYHLHHIRVLPSLCFFESHSLFLSFADDDQTSFLSHVFVRPCINVLVPSTCCWSQCWSFALDSFLASALMLFPRVINNCWWNTLSTLLTVWRWSFTRIFHPTADKNQEIELKKATSATNYGKYMMFPFFRVVTLMDSLSHLLTSHKWYTTNNMSVWFKFSFLISYQPWYRHSVLLCTSQKILDQFIITHAPIPRPLVASPSWW